MRLHNILIFFIMMLVTSVLNAQDFHTYKLFDNKFQTIFPGNPSIVLSRNNIKAFKYVDNINGIVYVAISALSGFKYDIGEYRQSIKKDLDKAAQANQLVSFGHKLIHFSSLLDRKKNIYIAISTSSFYLEGTQRFKSTKFITYKKTIYTWSVMYSKYSDKSIFDSYERSNKVLK